MYHSVWPGDTRSGLAVYCLLQGKMHHSTLGGKYSSTELGYTHTHVKHTNYTAKPVTVNGEIIAQL